MEITTRDKKTVRVTENQLILNPGLKTVKSGTILDVDEKSLAAVLRVTDGHCVPNRFVHEMLADQMARYSNLRDCDCFTPAELEIIALFAEDDSLAKSMHAAAIKTENTMCIRFLARAALQTNLWKNAKK